MPRLLLLAAVLLAAGCSSVEPARSEREERYDAHAAGDGYEDQWRAAMIAAELGDETNEPSRDRRLEYSKRGVANAESAIRLRDAGVEGHYYRALCLGRVLDNESLPTLALVPELRDEGLRAVERDPRFECAGAHRLLAILFASAPSVGGAWAIGDDDLAEEHFQAAMSLAPDCPENPIAYLEWKLRLGEIDADVGLEMLHKARARIDPHELSSEAKLRLHQRCLELEKKLKERRS